jgi:tetratricopeptide (TPR) repeat protein
MTVLLPRSLSVVAASLVLAGAACAQTSPAVPGKKIEAPHYGDTLFEFFQDKYFSALTGLMTSQNFTRLTPHDDEAEVLRGGMLLSYGNHREAAQVFERLIDQTASATVRNRAWYYLAKIRYQRDLPAEAQASLARIDGPLPDKLEEDRLLLEGQLMLARGDTAGAVRVLEPLAQPGRPDVYATEASGSTFARFNLGVALLKSKNAADRARGAVLLNAIGIEWAGNEEQRNLRDRANLALGFAALQQERGADARTFLERVRLNGQQSNKALLGFGWAAASLKQFDKAVIPWLELTQRDPGDAAVLEARLALPYAYAELGASGQALSLYEKTVADYESENLRLDQSVAAIRNGRWVQTLLERNPAEQMGWFANVRELPDAAAMPHASHLSQVMAQHAFQESFKNLRDVLFLERNLTQWRDNLVVFRDILDHRKRTFAERLPSAQGGASAAAQSLAAIRQRRDAQASELMHKSARPWRALRR